MPSLEDIADHGPLSLEQLQQIEAFLLNTRALEPDTARKQIGWFVRELGIDNYYFQTTAIEEMSRHILTLGAAEVVAKHGGEGVAIQVINEQSDKAIYIVEDREDRVLEIETRIEERYQGFRIESYSTRLTSRGFALRFYICTRAQYATPPHDQNRSGPALDLDIEADAEKPVFLNNAPESFLARSAPETVERYRQVWLRLHRRLTPVTTISAKRDSGEVRVMVGLHRGSLQQTLTGYSYLFRRLEVPVKRRYIEPFADGTLVLSFYIDPPEHEAAQRLSRELNAVAILPRNPITALFTTYGLSAEETLYAIAAAVYTHQFVSELSEGYAVLQDAVKHNPEAAGILETLQSGFTKNTFSNARIQSTVIKHPEVVRELFRHFRTLNKPANSGGADPGRFAQERAEFEQLLQRDVPYHRDRTIMRYFLRFNEFVESCNFFRTDKAALSFRLRSGFLSDSDYLEEPYGVFFVVGRQFVGFHVRFRDISRGGIRIVRSRTPDAYARNIDTVFQENYNLAATQQRKNKDIPEGGAKGILLLNPEFATGELAAENAFRAYVDSLLDLLPGTDHETPSDDTVSGGGIEVAATTSSNDTALFLGPDEGSAGLMDWAALHARRRGYPYWKSFTTGKPPSLGGLPHDRYGMTTRSVHAYVLGVLEKLGLKEEDVTKIQTGGPDGDLGSNEILVSRDTTLAVVDGSGVAYDPEGLNRTELRRLATARLTIEQFNRELLSPQGFFVGIADRDVQLPDGSMVANGEDFRNRFHLSSYFRADVFVPCGGRPGAITVANWKLLLDETGTPKVKIIVEGANLFITQEARLRLESAGVLLFKDASTNKGGVTSSSFEVYAGLSLSDEQWSTDMCFEHEESAFRLALVKEITDRIQHNSRAEFELLWKEHELRKTSFTLLSDQISERINGIADAVMRSPFLADGKLRTQMISRYTPRVLLDAVGMNTLAERVPAAYLDAVMAASIASEFVYQHGLGANEVAFAEYLRHLQAE